MGLLKDLFGYIQDNEDPEFDRRVVKKENYKDVVFYEMFQKHGKNTRRFMPFLTLDSQFGFEKDNFACAITWGGYDHKEYYFIVYYNIDGKLDMDLERFDRPKNFTATKSNIYNLLVKYKNDMFSKLRSE
jgi:hypothetical protein